MTRNKKPNKIPAQSTEDRLRYTKGQISGLKNELKRLKERVRDLERLVLKLVSKKETVKDSDENKRLEILKKFHPCYREDK